MPSVHVVRIEQHGLGFDLRQLPVTLAESASAVGRHVRHALSRQVDGVEEGTHGHRHVTAPNRMRENNRAVGGKVGEGGLEGRPRVCLPLLFRPLRRGAVFRGIGFDRFETKNVSARETTDLFGDGLGTSRPGKVDGQKFGVCVLGRAGGAEERERRRAGGGFEAVAAIKAGYLETPEEKLKAEHCALESASRSL